MQDDATRCCNLSCMTRKQLFGNTRRVCMLVKAPPPNKVGEMEGGGELNFQEERLLLLIGFDFKIIFAYPNSAFYFDKVAFQ